MTKSTEGRAEERRGEVWQEHGWGNESKREKGTSKKRRQPSKIPRLVAEEIVSGEVKEEGVRKRHCLDVLTWGLDPRGSR